MMPASLFCEMDRNNGFEDQRAFQLAFELSMLGLSDPIGSTVSSSPVVPASVSETTDTSSTINNHITPPFVMPEESRSKKSQNMTECVPVPSSEHVAEIVGRQGKGCCYLLFVLLSRQSQ